MDKETWNGALGGRKRQREVSLVHSSIGLGGGDRTTIKTEIIVKPRWGGPQGKKPLQKPTQTHSSYELTTSYK